MCVNGDLDGFDEMRECHPDSMQLSFQCMVNWVIINALIEMNRGANK